MKLLNIIKYHLLTWLLNDICSRSGENNKCDNCLCRSPVYMQIGDFTIDEGGCGHQDILYQARKVWGVK